jgi:hypothetical protein
MTAPRLPKSCEEHQPKYAAGAWQNYTPLELGMWVHLMLKRAGHRADAAKKAKDIEDAQNYLNMLQAHVDSARTS